VCPPSLPKSQTGNLVFAALGAAQIQDIDPGVIYPISAIVALPGSWAGSFRVRVHWKLRGKEEAGIPVRRLCTSESLGILVFPLQNGQREGDYLQVHTCSE
jgi:hypothetical protein